MTSEPIEFTTSLTQFDLSEFVRRVLAEDMGSGGDVTSMATIAADARFSATMNCREPISVAGLDIAIAFFKSLDREVRIAKHVEDGDWVPAGTLLLNQRLRGNVFFAVNAGTSSAQRRTITSKSDRRMSGLSS